MGKDYTEEEKKQLMLRKMAIGAFQIPKWPKVALSGVEMVWDFWIFIFLVIALSITEDDEVRCVDKVIVAIGITIGFRFTGFAFHGTKFILVMFNQLAPNALGLLDTILFVLEAAWSVWFLIVFGTEGSNCKDQSSILYVAMIISILNAVIKFVQALVYLVMTVLATVFFVAKMMTLNEIGEFFGFLGVFFGGEEEEESKGRDAEEERKLADDQ